MRNIGLSALTKFFVQENIFRHRFLIDLLTTYLRARVNVCLFICLFVCLIRWIFTQLDWSRSKSSIVGKIF